MGKFTETILMHFLMQTLLERKKVAEVLKGAPNLKVREFLWIRYVISDSISCHFLAYSS